MNKMNSIGMIRGGQCEKIFHQRMRRQEGTTLAWEWLLENKCVRVNYGWYRIMKLPKIVFSFRWVIKKCSNGDKEIGWRRYMKDVAKQLYKNKRKFRLGWMIKWIEGIASFELGARSVDGEPLTGAHALGAGPSKVIFGYASPHQPQLYEQYQTLDESEKVLTKRL